MPVANFLEGVNVLAVARYRIPIVHEGGIVVRATADGIVSQAVAASDHVFTPAPGDVVGTITADELAIVSYPP
jgi:hypothetical protein